MNIITKNNIRYTEIRGKLIPHVTSIIGGVLAKPRVIDWAVMETIKFLVEQETMDEAVVSEAYKYYKNKLSGLAEKGTARHKQIEDYLKTKKYQEDAFIKKFLDWETEQEFKVKYTEKFLVNDKYGFCGSIDLIGYCQDIPYIIDIKTSRAIHSSHKIQVCAYKLLVNKPQLKLAILRIDREGKSKSFYTLTAQEEELYTRIFLNTLSIFKDLEEMGDLA